MTSLKRFIHEVHRRSIWQVLSVYLMGSWGALQVVEGVTENAGLPDWVPPFALVLLVIGLPVVLATAFVQEGMPGAGQGPDERPREGQATDAPVRDLAVEDPAPASQGAPAIAAPGLLTWRNAVVGGGLAFSLLAVLVAGYFVMRATGVGPVASLAAQGVIDAGEPVILAEFANTSSDPSLGGVVTEALRVDLSSSRAITLIQPARIADALGRMQRDASEPLTASLAAEVAVRDGVKAVIEGEVGSAGSGYILVATLRAPDTGAALATFRRTAAGPDEVISAIDGLSQDIREKAGESLRSIKGEEPLEAVTTTSLEALRKFSEAERLSEMGESRRAKTLLQEAVALDPNFGMAWRKLSVVIQTAGGEPGEEEAAATRAYELRGRLTERERGNAIAYYHNVVTGDVSAQMEAYENLLASYPDDPPALNNLAIAYHDRTRHEEALVLLERAVGGPGESGPAHVNMVVTHAYLSDVTSAWTALEVMEAKYPVRDTWNLWDRWLVTSISGNHQVAHDLGEDMSVLSGVSPGWRSSGYWMMAVEDMARGRVREAWGHLDGESARARSEGRHGDVVGAKAGDLARLVERAPTVARRRALEIVKSDSWSSLPAVSRPYGSYVRLLAVLGETAAAAVLMDEWVSEIGAAASFAQREARRITEAMSLAENDPAAAADALERFQREGNCPRCVQWELADLSVQAGRLERAAELYVQSTEVSQAWDAFVLHRVMAHERLGEVYEAMGENAKAAEHYARFAELWADADADLQPRVRHARERAAALGDGS